MTTDATLSPNDWRHVAQRNRGMGASVRFWEKVDKSSAGECWLWLAATSPLGYGRFFPKHGASVLAHRFAYEELVGPVPTGLELDHLCRVPGCVNPAHLEPVTHAENVRRGRSGRACATKTHCSRGHPYDEENTRWYDGHRWCRTCERQRVRVSTEHTRALSREAQRRYAARKRAPKP